MKMTVMATTDSAMKLAMALRLRKRARLKIKVPKMKYLPLWVHTHIQRRMVK